MPIQPRPRYAVVAALTAIVVVLFGIAAPAGAHSGKQSYVYLDMFDDAIEGRVEFPARDLGPLLGVDFTENPDTALAVTLANAEAIQAYTAEHIALGDGTTEWDISFDQDVGVLPVSVGPYILVPFVVEQSFDSAPREFTVTYDGIIHSNDEKDAFLLFENDWGTAVFQNEADEFVGFSVGRTTQSVTLDDVGSLSSMAGVRGLGTDAVRTGIDALLFVIAILLPVALLVPRGRLSDPAPSTESVLRSSARTLGVFAAAHSITLWIVGLGGIDLPDRLTTSLVAASLLVAAASVVAWPRTSSSARLALIGGLGVVQGLGFGLAFNGFGLDRRQPVQSLIAFNIGIEVAVIVIAALVLPVLLLLRRTKAAGVVLYGTAIVIAGYAVAWLVERIGDNDLDIESVANPFRVWPRNLFIMLGVMAISAGFLAWSASREKLRPVESPTDTRTSDRPDDALVSS